VDDDHDTVLEKILPSPFATGEVRMDWRLGAISLQLEENGDPINPRDYHVVCLQQTPRADNFLCAAIASLLPEGRADG
jgi:hypothetical protein